MNEIKYLGMNRDNKTNMHGTSEDLKSKLIPKKCKGITIIYKVPWQGTRPVRKLHMNVPRGLLL